MQSGAPNPTLRDYLAPLRSRWWLVLLCLLILAGAGYAYWTTRSNTYQAMTKLYVQSPQSLSLTGASQQTSQNYVADQATLVTATGQAKRVATRLSLPGGAPAAANAVTASEIGTTDFLSVQATAKTAARAISLANTFAQEYELTNTAKVQAQARKQLTSLENQLATVPKGVANATARTTLVAEIDQARVLTQTVVGNVSQVDPAVSATSTKKSGVIFTVLGGIAGLLVGILLAYLLAGMDPRLKSVGEAGDAYHYPVLAAVPHDPQIDYVKDGVVALSPRSREAFRDLRIALDLAAAPGSFKTIAVCSASPSEGKTSVARSLAIAFAEVGKTVVVVDLDLRKSRLAKAFRAPHEPGISEVVAGKATLEEVKYMTRVSALAGKASKRKTPSFGEDAGPGFTTDFELTVIPPGRVPPNPVAVIEDERLLGLIDELAGEYDIVVVDTAPITAVSDAIPVLGRVEAAVMVARNGTTDTRSVRLATEILERIHGLRVAGVVVNDLSSNDSYAYGRGYGYGYG